MRYLNQYLGELSRICILTALLALIGCSILVGGTGANEGKRVGDWVEYKVFHPGLKITILEPYKTNLLPISTIGKTSPSPLTHTVTWVTTNTVNGLVIVGRFSKKIYLNGRFYTSLRSANILIKNGNLLVDGQKVTATVSNSSSNH